MYASSAKYSPIVCLFLSSKQWQKISRVCFFKKKLYIIYKVSQTIETNKIKNRISLHGTKIREELHTHISWCQGQSLLRMIKNINKLLMIIGHGSCYELLIWVNSTELKWQCRTIIDNSAKEIPFNARVRNSLLLKKRSKHTREESCTWESPTSLYL